MILPDNIDDFLDQLPPQGLHVLMTKIQARLNPPVTRQFKVGDQSYFPIKASLDLGLQSELTKKLFRLLSSVMTKALGKSRHHYFLIFAMPMPDSYLIRFTTLQSIGAVWGCWIAHAILWLRI